MVVSLLSLVGRGAMPTVLCFYEIYWLALEPWIVL